MSDEAILSRLMRVIEERKRDMPADSYTAQLLAGGVERIGSKVAEEAAEVVEAAGEPGQEGQAHLVREAADLLYHLFVLLASRSATWPEVEAELAGRFGLSGLAEKANRPPKPRPGG